MEKIIIHADYSIASDLIDSLYHLYLSAVEGVGGDPDSGLAQAEGINYAKHTFCRLTEEFERKVPMKWVWVKEDAE